MSIAKVIEVIAQSEKSWDNAAAQALAEASRTVENILHIYVENLQATVEDNQMRQYRVNAKISFTVNEGG